MTPAFRAIYGDQLADAVQELIDAAYERGKRHASKPVEPPKPAEEEPEQPWWDK